MPSAANRRVALTTGQRSAASLRLTPPRTAKKSAADSNTPPASSSANRSRGVPVRSTKACSWCGRLDRTQKSSGGRRCHDCRTTEKRLKQLWKCVPVSHHCPDPPTRETCWSIDHRRFYSLASSLAVRTRGRANLSIEHIAATIKDRVEADARLQAETTKTKAERKRAEREAAAARAAAQRALAAERAEAARIAKLERRARRLMDEIRAETPPSMPAAALAAKHGLTVTATGEHDAPSR